MNDNGCISIRQVSKHFGKSSGKDSGKNPVLDNITFQVEKSMIFGILGPSGAGKTTLVRMVAGIDSPSSGEVEVLHKRMPNLDVMNRIGFMAQSDALYSELSAQENLEFFASVYGLKGDKKKQRIRGVLELVDLTEHRKKTVAKFSGGMKRRLSLAAALMHEPDVLILDEPTVGIDPILRKSIWDELTRLTEEKETAIIVTTHVMDEAEKCQRLGMLRDGRLIAVGTPGELKARADAARLEEAFLYYGGVGK